MRRIWIGIVLILAVAAGGVVAYRAKATSADKTAYTSVPVSRGDLTVSILTTGVVQPENRVEIKPPIAGRIEKVVVYEGQRVKPGDVLAWMSSTERAALLDAARAKGADELKRWQELYNATPLVAPLNGQIIARNVEAGQTVAATDTVYVLSDHLIVEADVDETDLSRVRLGQDATFNLDAYPELDVEAQVAKIGLEAKTVNNVTTYRIDVLPKRVPKELKSGMTANVSFITESREGVLLVPAEAIQRRKGHHQVLVPGPTPKSEPVAKDVQTGVTDGKQTEILSGLNEGDTVLVASVQLPKASASGTTNPLGMQPRRRR